MKPQRIQLSRKERPILMSAPMVPPTLDGTKTNTRRGDKREQLAEALFSQTGFGIGWHVIAKALGGLRGGRKGALVASIYSFLMANQVAFKEHQQDLLKMDEWEERVSVARDAMEKKLGRPLNEIEEEEIYKTP